MNVIVDRAVTLSSFIYISMGLLGYIAYCNLPTIPGNILVAFPSTILAESVKLCFLMSVAVSFPLCLFPCRASIHSLLYPSHSVSHLCSLKIWFSLTWNCTLWKWFTWGDGGQAWWSRQKGKNSSISEFSWRMLLIYKYYIQYVTVQYCLCFSLVEIRTGIVILQSIPTWRGSFLSGRNGSPIFDFIGWKGKKKRCGKLPHFTMHPEVSFSFLISSSRPVAVLALLHEIAWEKLHDLQIFILS